MHDEKQVKRDVVMLVMFGCLSNIYLHLSSEDTVEVSERKEKETIMARV